MMKGRKLTMLVPVLLVLQALPAAPALAEEQSYEIGSVACDIVDGSYLINIPVEGEDYGWVLDGSLEDGGILSIAKAQYEDEGFAVQIDPVSDGEDTVTLMHHYNAIACDQILTWDLKVEEGKITECTGGSQEIGPAEEEIDSYINGQWVEKDTQFTQMSIEKNPEQGWNVEIVSPMTQEAYLFKTTAYFDCVEDALIYDEGERYDLPAGYPDEELQDPVMGGLFGGFRLDGTDPDNLAIQWINNESIVFHFDEENTDGSIIFVRAGESEVPEPVDIVDDGETEYAEVLTLWAEDSVPKEMLTTYMAAITEEGSEDYIPPADRIAVFDLDGTLFCETDPNYFDYMLLLHRVLEDPDYKDQASDFEKVTALKIKHQNETGESFSGLEVDHGKAIASSFAGMTLDEFNAYIQEFKKLPMPSYEGLNRGDGWYLPMLQVVEYLQENDFTVYVVSGTDRFIVRGIVYDSPLHLPPRNIIGSDETVVASKQGDEDGLNYVFVEDDQLILGGEFVVKNLKMNKVAVIMQEIGQQPVLSFGNSTGDASMAEYVTSNNRYPSMAFMLCCDDTVRENGNESKASKMFTLCESFGWIPVSMRDDWTTIYGDGVVKK